MKGNNHKKWSSISLSEEEVFDFQSGLWKGKKEPFIKAPILRNTNFTNEGYLDYSDVAILPIEKRYFEKKQLQPQDIIIERSGGGPNQPVGRVVFFDRNDQPFFFSNFTSRLRVVDKNIVYPLFLHYFLLFFHWSGKTEKLQSRTTGIRNLSFTDYKGTEIPLLPLPDQKKIAAILSAVQEAREKTEAVIQAAKALKKSMMKHLFTYGPVPVSEAEKVELQDTEIGSVPKNWRKNKLGEIAEIKSGGTPSRKVKKYWNGSIPWVKTGNIDFNRIRNADEYITDEGLKNSSTRIVPRGTLLMAMYGQGVTRGKVGIMDIEAAINQACAAIFPQNNIESEYLFHFFQYHYEYLREFGHGANQKNLSGALLKTFPVIHPHLSVQLKIIEQINSIDQKIASETARKEALDTLFQSLLDQLMTGKLRVADLDIPIKDT